MGLRLPPTPLSINAYVSGKIVEIEEGKSVSIETKGSFIQGIFGVGGERHGKIVSLPFENEKIITASDLNGFREEVKDGIVIGGASFTAKALDFAKKLGASGVITGSIDADTLSQFVGYEIGVSITGDEDVPFTLIITEGFGQLPM